MGLGIVEHGLAVGRRTDLFEEHFHGQPVALAVLRSGYERPAADSVVADDLRLLAGGSPVEWEAGADGVRYVQAARLLVTAEDRIVVTGLCAGDVLELRLHFPEEESLMWAGRASASTQLVVEGAADVTTADGRIWVRA